MVEVGQHERTRRAITTHTGGDADDPAIVSALMRAHGAIEVADIVELTETLAAFQTVQRPAGRRIAVITSSGGLAELILDVRL
jgi:acetyltransferase